MNIVIVGGGTEKKFGNDFALKARHNGHDVIIVSHKTNQSNDPNQFVADFSTLETFLNDFKKATQRFDNIDILIYNTNTGSYPNNVVDLQSPVREKDYFRSIKVHVVYPHALALECQSKMKAGSKIIFMTSSMSLDINRTVNTQMAGYAGSKAYQNHLMLGLAYHNSNGIIVSSIAPRFDYSKTDNCQITLDKIYDYVLTHTTDMNGKIVRINENPGIQILN